MVVAMVLGIVVIDCWGADAGDGNGGKHHGNDCQHGDGGGCDDDDDDDDDDNDAAFVQ